MNVKKEIYTIDDIYALPDGERAKLIDGQIYYIAPSSAAHQRGLIFLSTEINLYIRKNNGFYYHILKFFSYSKNQIRKSVHNKERGISYLPLRSLHSFLFSIFHQSGHNLLKFPF